MAEWFEAWRVEKFRNDVQILLQDKGGKIREAGAVTIGTGYSGKAISPVNQMGESDAREVTERYGDTPHMEVAADRRWLYPSPVEWGHMIDRFDRLWSDIEPTGPLMMVGLNGMRRKEDNLILKALYGTAKTGERGETTVTFPASQQVDKDVGGNDTGINHEKLRAGIEKLGESEIDLDSEQIFMGITMKEWNTLFGFNTTTSADFTSSGGGGRPINTGKLPELYGITFIRFQEQRLRANGFYDAAGAQLKLPMWVKSGVHFGIWEERNSDILRRPDKKNIPHIYMTQTFGVTRTEEARVVQINVQRDA